ncbi:MAG: hypothetical protein IT442_05970 [Phycisphaeraceae bacterium]|nr:hypothetical protein [Phycisphaeraceae bacterium]
MSESGVMLVLGYRPFLEPVSVDGWWPLLLLPVVLAMATAYKTLRVGGLRSLAGEVAALTGQVVGLLVLIAVVLWWLTR